ncbi:hypothetical protein GCM10009069_10400 [Algimonas arctica]|uniref:Uncharacterized protein n=1 Tax=Algimonas arctica TaxID=1479486 RepID=A0A8J3CNV5_9PROT|nr:hypothetical protein [Algimonas arctica]GHA89254.1 hypothetical protein GCM10009069_10400 [Algimonas arctica]
MIGLIRNIVVIFLILTVVYVILSQWSRWRERVRLAEDYRAQTELFQQSETEDNFVARGMARYNRSLRSKLFLSVYAIPGAIATLLVWLAQHS